MEHRRAVPIDTFHIPCREVREANPPARVRNYDLPRMEVPGEDDVKDTRNPADDPREVAEQDAQIGAGVDEVLRTRASVGVRPGIDTDDLNAPSSELELDALVAQEGDTLERIDCGRIDALRERIAAVGEVVVAEYDVAAADVGEKACELAHARTPRHEVAGDENEIRPALASPDDRIFGRASTARPDPEMEIGEMHDADPV
jgi:hypothetical protein